MGHCVTGKASFATTQLSDIRRFIRHVLDMRAESDRVNIERQFRTDLVKLELPASREREREITMLNA